MVVKNQLFQLSHSVMEVWGCVVSRVVTCMDTALVNPCDIIHVRAGENVPWPVCCGVWPG